MSPLTSEPQGLSTAVVLVVEDNPLILMTALDLVTTSGFQGIGAASADEAIAILEVRRTFAWCSLMLKCPVPSTG